MERLSLDSEAWSKSWFLPKVTISMGASGIMFVLFGAITEVWDTRIPSSLCQTVFRSNYYEMMSICWVASQIYLNGDKAAESRSHAVHWPSSSSSSYMTIGLQSNTSSKADSHTYGFVKMSPLSCASCSFCFSWPLHAFFTLWVIQCFSAVGNIQVYDHFLSEREITLSYDQCSLNHGFAPLPRDAEVSRDFFRNLFQYIHSCMP